jgi:hypothetical protein
MISTDLQNAAPAWDASDTPDVFADAVKDEKLNLSETQDLSNLPSEIQATILEKLTWELELTTDIAGQLGDVTPDTAQNNPTMAKQKTIQFIIKLHQLAKVGSTIRLDGRIWDKTKTALKAIVPSYNEGVITQAVISELVAATNTALEAKTQSIQEAREAEEKAAREAAEAKEAAENEARAVVSAFDWDDRANASRDDIKALQTALKTLEYPVNVIDGIITPGRATEQAYNAEMEKIGSQVVSSELAQAQSDVRIRDNDRSFSEESLAKEREKMRRAKAALDGAINSAASTQAAVDAANVDYSNASMDTRELWRAMSEAQAAMERATEAAAEAQAAVDAANVDYSNASMDTRELWRAMSEAQAAVERATEAAAEAQAAVDAANVDYSNASMDTRELWRAISEAQSRLDSKEEALNAATDIRERVQARINDINYSTTKVNRNPNVDWITAEQAQEAFDIAENNYKNSVENQGSFIENIEATDHEYGLRGYDEKYFNAAIILALVIERDAQSDFDTASDAKVEAIRAEWEARTALADAEAKLAAAVALDESAEATVLAREWMLSDASSSAATARTALADAEAKLAAAVALDDSAEATVLTREWALSDASDAAATARTALADAEAKLAAAVALDDKVDWVVDARKSEHMDEVQDFLQASRDNNAFIDALDTAKDAELTAYINSLAHGNLELTAMLEEDPAKMRALIEGMRDSNPGDLGKALAYFGGGVELGNATEITGDLVVALVEYTKTQDGLPLSLGTAEYVIALNEAYQVKADELGAFITAANSRKYLSTGYAAAENMFNTTIGIPDLELVTQDGVVQINNGFRGRPRVHRHTTTTETTTHTDLTTHRHHSRIHDGENISSTHPDPTTERIATAVTSSTATSVNRWVEKFQWGIDRDAMSELINSGEATLRPSYELMSRLFRPEVGTSGEVTLRAEKWYEEMQTWQADLEKRGGEETIINNEVSISSKTLSGAMAEVESESADRHTEIISEVRTDLVGSKEFSFLLWDHVANKERGSALQLVGREESTPDGVKWQVAIFNPTTGEVVDKKTYDSADEMLNSDMGQKAIEMSSYRYLWVVNSTEEGGLRIADDQGLIRCGDHEKVVLLDEPAPELPQGYNFIRTGLPCGVLGAFCTSSSNTIHTENIKNYEEHKFTETRTTTSEPDGDGPNGDNGGVGSTETWVTWSVGEGTGWVSDPSDGDTSTSEGDDLG